MLPTPWRRLWLSSAALMGVLRLRKRAMKSSIGMVRGSWPGPAYFVSALAEATTERRPKRRASTKRSSRPLLRVRMAWVWGGMGVSGVETSRRPVMPRWMRNWAARLLWLRSTTMVLPTRWTRSMRLWVRVPAIWAGEDLKVWGLLLVQTDWMVWPRTRSWTPLAMVSTSGSSGMAFCSIWAKGLTPICTDDTDLKASDRGSSRKARIRDLCRGALSVYSERDKLEDEGVFARLYLWPYDEAYVSALHDGLCCCELFGGVCFGSGPARAALAAGGESTQ